MKTKVSLGVVIIVMVILIAVSGSAMAARPVPPGNETSQIHVKTSASVIGNFGATTELVLQQSTGDLVPPLTTGEQVGMVGYYETTMAVDGETTYNKETQINTGGIGENLQNTRIITFDGGDDGGRMVSNEEVIVVTMGTEAASEFGCCPWGSTQNASIPANYEYVQAGSKMDVTEVSATSVSSVKVISDIPAPVTLDYSIDAHGITQTPGTMDSPAIGSAIAYVDGQIMQGSNGSTQSTDMVYHDVTSVDGLFDLSKDVSYSSAPS